MDAPTIKIGSVTATLRPVGITAAVSLAVPPDDPRADDPGFTLALGAAALRAAWPDGVAWPARKRPRPMRLGSDVATYGAEILDALYPESGLTLAALAALLHEARAWAVSSGLSEAEVAAAADFSDAPEVEGA
jgi:hypothetical protein